MTDDAAPTTPAGPDPASYVERHRAHAAARAAHGSVVPDGAGRWTVVGHGAVTEALREIGTFVGAIGGEGASDDERILQWVPEPRHTQMRRAIMAPIAPTRLRTIESFVRELSRRLLAEALDAGTVDLVAALADPVPTQTLAALFGVPPGDAQHFQRLSDELLARQGQVAAGASLQSIHPGFAAYVDGLVADRRAGLRGVRVDGDDADDIVTALLAARVGDEQLSDAAVRTQVMMLIIAGSETTRNLLGNLLARLAAEPQLYARLRQPDGAALVDTVIEESLRRDPPVQLLMRRCAHATELAGTELAAGDAAVVSIAAANRDPSVFVDPDAFVGDRANVRQHVAFGTGPHVCPGAALARMEARVVLHELAAAVKSMRPLADRPVAFHDVVWAHGPASFWVELR